MDRILKGEINNKIIFYSKKNNCIIFVNPVKIKGTKFKQINDCNYIKLANALLLRITKKQLERITIITNSNENIILFEELVNCFYWDGGYEPYARGRCICCVHITEIFFVHNYEKEKDEGNFIPYPIGNECILNWNTFASHKNSKLLYGIFCQKIYKNDKQTTKRCYFCNDKILKKEKHHNNNCIHYENCKKAALKWIKFSFIYEKRNLLLNLKNILLIKQEKIKKTEQEKIRLEQEKIRLEQEKVRKIQQEKNRLEQEKNIIEQEKVRLEQEKVRKIEQEKNRKIEQEKINLILYQHHLQKTVERQILIDARVAELENGYDYEAGDNYKKIKNIDSEAIDAIIIKYEMNKKYCDRTKK